MASSIQQLETKEKLEKASKPENAYTETKLVVIEYNDLTNPDTDLKSKIEAAFGVDGLGILAVRGVPNVETQRAALLPLGPRLASQPQEVLRTYEHPKSLWSFGWSCGKEKLQGRPDYSKGSWYANPIENDPFNSDPEIVDTWPSFAHPNIWPTEHLPELEKAFMDLGTTIYDTGKLLAAHCDLFVQSHSRSFEQGRIHRTIRQSRITKGRFLHYFAKTDEDLKNNDVDDMFSSWCGWHNDHGSLTGLVPAMFFDESKESAVALPRSPDPKSGLYIRGRDGNLYKVRAPGPDHLLFQIGETAQIHSGGILQATPHAVRGPAVAQVSRCTLAVFMEPGWEEPMNCPDDRRPAQAQSSLAEARLPIGVSPLGSRWGSPNCPFTTCDFGAFTKETLGALHD